MVLIYGSDTGCAPSDDLLRPFPLELDSMDIILDLPFYITLGAVIVNGVGYLSFLIFRIA